LFSYSRNEYKADRNVIFTGINRTAHSQTEGNQFSMNADSGYDFKVNHFRVGPTVGLEYVRLRF
jgi:uncharacterized protein YhjY with autotransporter beta-barrel domain